MQRSVAPYAFVLVVAGACFALALASGCQTDTVLHGDFYLPVDSDPGVSVRQSAVTVGDGPGGAHIIFLNFGGAMITTTTNFRDNSAKNQSQIAKGSTNYPAFNASPYAPAYTAQTAADKVTATFLDFYKDFNVQIVNTRPASGRYTMCMVGGQPSAVGIGGSAAGIAPLDCGNANEPDVVYAFAEVLTPQNTGSANNSLKAIAVTCAQEVAHAFGLGHTTNKQDIMYPQLSNTVVGFAGTSTLYSDGSGQCLGQGATQQDSKGELTKVLGAGTAQGPGPSPGPGPTPMPSDQPMVGFVTPTDGSTVPLTFDIVVTAIATSGKTIDRIDVGSGGQTLFSLTSAPRKRTVTAPQSGQYDLDATAYDSAGGSASATVTFTAKSGAPPQKIGCQSDSECNAGLTCVGGECVLPMPAPTCSEPCPSGTTCQPDGTCKASDPGNPGPDPGTVGAACEDDSQCPGSTCVDFGNGVKTCTTTCDPQDAMSCPGGTTCVLSSGQDFMCRPSGGRARGTGGCSATPVESGPGGAMLAACFALIAATLLRKRRSARPR